MAAVRYGAALHRAKRASRLARRNPALFLRKLMAKARLILLPARNGKATLLVGSVRFECDFSLSKQVQHIYRRAWQIETAESIKRLLASGGTFIDVGAHVGYMSAIALDRVGSTGEVHAFEPVPRYFSRLSHLAEINPRHRLVANRVALSDRAGDLTIHVADPSTASWGFNTARKDLLSSEEPPVEVIRAPMMRLDDYLEQNGISDVSLIKIDVEGYESFVVEGMTHFLESCRPPIICEIDPASASAPALLSVLRGFGYSPRSLADLKSDVADDLLAGTEYDVVFVSGK